MRVRNVRGPTALKYPGERAVPVVGPSPSTGKREGYEAARPGDFQYPNVEAVGLGDDNFNASRKGQWDYAKGYSRKLDLDEN